MNDEQYIQDYLNDRLSENEKQVFENRLKTDTDFKTEVDWHCDLNLAFTHNETEDLKKELAELEANNKKKQYVSPFQKQVYLAIAVALVLGFFYNIFNVATGNRLYDNYYEIYPNVEQPVVRGSNDGDISEVFLAYENNNFTQAIEGFKQLLEQKENPNYRFYLAMSFLNNNNDDLALRQLIKLESLDFDYKAETLWYSALILIKQEKKEEAKSKLEILDKLNSPFKSQERKVLLEKL